MKTAQLHISVFELTCPHCDEYISHNSGSHMFQVHEEIPKTVECDSCGKTVKVPKKVEYFRRGCK